MTVDKFGLVGFIFYWGVLGLGIKAVVLNAGAPTALEVFLLVLLPLLLLFFREPLHYLMTRKRGGHRPSVLSGVIEGFVDVLETVSSYIANTVSFVRVGAFALAHTALCVAVFSTERVVRTLPGGPLWSVLVVVGGNLLVIGLEGMVVSIQSMRLEYYEFFSKFFKGEGKAYQPFKLS
jgi:V/A-type H+-transporting ATPase subunit I